MRNSAWIYVPVVDAASVATSGGVSTANVSMSILWYHVGCDSAGGVRVGLEKIVSGSGYMQVAASTGMDPYQSAVKSCVRDLLTRTKEMGPFRLSGQVVSASAHSARIDIGMKAGISVNDRYALVQTFEDSSGKSKKEDVGWVRTWWRNESDASARVVSGKPYPGLELREIPLSKWSLEFGYRREPLSVTTVSCRDVSTPSYYSPYSYVYYPATSDRVCDGRAEVSKGTMSGFLLDAHYSPTWWYGLAFGIGVGQLFGEEYSTDLRASVRQTIPVYRRLGVFAQPEIAARILLGADPKTVTDAEGKSSSMPPGVLQTGIVYGAEIALAPDWNLRLGLGTSSISGLDYYSDGNQVTMGERGLTLSVLFEWTPRGMPVDPLDLMVGQSWNPNAVNQPRR